jgi:hypothetical protein
MPSLCRFAALLVVVGLAAHRVNTVSADEASAPSVNVVLSGAEEVLKDVKFLLGLTNQQEQKQEIVLKSYLEDVFFVGIDRKLPVCMEMKFGNPSTRQVWSFPVDKFNDFRNVTLKDVDHRQTKGGESLRAIEQFQRLDEICTTLRQHWRTTGRPPAGDPRASIKDLLKNYDAAAECNTKIDQSQADRRKTFANTRGTARSPEKGKDETQANFDLKQLFEYQLDEAERFFVESERLTLGWTTDGDKQQGRLDIELAPIPGSSLEKIVSGLGTTPSYFANIERSAKPILSGRLNHPLDEPRKKSLNDLAGARDRAKTVADASTTSRPRRKQPPKITDQVFDMLTAGTNAGLMTLCRSACERFGQEYARLRFRTADGTGVAEIPSFPQRARTSGEGRRSPGRDEDPRSHHRRGGPPALPGIFRRCDAVCRLVEGRRLVCDGRKRAC